MNKLEKYNTKYDGRGDYPTNQIIRKCGRCGYIWHESPLDLED